jgi:alkyl sulfatase BDS1-like metallo-beta-lactamase superfamily hydrolase
MEAQIDPKKSASLEKTVKVTFTDLKKSWAIHVRRGVAEVTQAMPEKVDATLSLKREVWAEIVLKKLSMDKAISSGKAKVSGSKKDFAAVFGAFE